MQQTSRITKVHRTHIGTGDGALVQLGRFLVANRMNRNKIFILTDANTHHLCLPVLLEQLPVLNHAAVLEIPAGEAVKSLQTAETLWLELLSKGADRDTLLINLGGGVVSDLGGFVASGFKRGIRYINLPTTLIGQADAAIGGKTGVNLGSLKNQVGSFYLPVAVFLYPRFLETLPFEHLRSGFAEVVKSALIGDAVIWHRIEKQGGGRILEMPLNSAFWRETLEKTVSQKLKIVRDDFTERKQRKKLNFGHTVGHALETFLNGAGGEGLLHGDAVAIGMVAEGYLSHKKCGLPMEEFRKMDAFLRATHHADIFKPHDIPQLIEQMYHDKKNAGGTIRFSLIRMPGVAVVDVVCTEAEIAEALQFVSNG
jgi:3-dehydroquinate synthase